MVRSIVQSGSTDETRIRNSQIRSTAVTCTLREPSQTCYGRKAGLQAVAPFQEQWQENSTLIRGKFRLRQRQELAGHGFHRRTSGRAPQVVASAQTQTRRDGRHRLAVAEQLQRQGLPRGQDRRGLLGVACRSSARVA